MAAATRDPAMLRELFAALGDDPLLIRECLARPILADRLVRSAYASDSRLHAAARGRADEGHAVARLGWRGGAADGERTEITWLRRDPAGASPADRPRMRGTIIVDDPEEWDRLRARLAGWFGLHPGRAGRPGDPRDGSAGDGAGLSHSGATPGDVPPASDTRLDRAWSRLPLDAPTPVLESPDRFFVAMVSRREPDAVTVVTIHWPKRSFDEWWAEARGPLADGLAGGSAPPATPSFVVGPRPPTANGGETAGPKPPTVPADSSTGTFAAPEYPRESPAPVFVPEMQGLACADDTWTAIRAGTSPEERDSHSAVWTGTEMIVWGGAGVSGALNSGGRYNPATDTWTPTGLGTGVPTARWNQTAVWTGTEMIIWGGYSGAAETNTGARYNPATNGWTAVAGGAAVPSAAAGPHGGLDGNRDDRLGRRFGDARLPRYGRQVQPDIQHLVRDLDHRPMSRGALPPHGGLDRQRDDRLGRPQRHSAF